MEANFALAQMSRASLNLESKTKHRFHIRSNKKRSATLPAIPTPYNTEIEDDTEIEEDSTEVKQFKSAAKAGRLLGLSAEATKSRQDQLTEIERNYVRSLQNSDQIRPIEENFQLGEDCVTTTRQTRANSSPSALPSRSLSFELGTENIQGGETRRSTLPHVTTSTAAERSPNTTSQGTELKLRRGSSVPRRVLEKALSVKRRLTLTKRSLDIPVFVVEEDDPEEFIPDLAGDVGGFELDLPLHISQDKSELDYIRRKNMDAMLQIDTDVPAPACLKDDEIDWRTMEPIVPIMCPESSNSVSTEASTSSADPATPVTPSNLPIANSRQATIPAIRNTEIWREVEWHMDAVVSREESIAGDQSPKSSPADALSIHADQFSLPESSVGQEDLQREGRSQRDLYKKFKKPRRSLPIQEQILEEPL
ncbi:hypothetical protein VTL71DRAFT_5903 [Oculimacula yallundae]|uniref:Uncharacterized protein n=1 Tax=Oculimacula yallundae TaxID=86028 RepID=A0ABR4BYU6_9HELO